MEGNPDSRIREILPFLESGIRESFASGIRNSGFWNPDTAQGIRNPTNDWNLEFDFH